MSDTSDVIVEARAHILSHAGPLDRMTSDARKGFKAYMETEVKFNGVTESRAWHGVNSEGFRETFFARLSWVGYYAIEAAKARHKATTERRERIGDMVALELEDLLESEQLVRPLSATGGCDIIG